MIPIQTVTHNISIRNIPCQVVGWAPEVCTAADGARRGREGAR